jgi:hypothetical protein
MTNMKWRIFVAAAAVAITSRLTTAQDDVLVPGGPVEFLFQPLKLYTDTQDFIALTSADDEKDADAGSTEYWLGVQVAVVPEIAKRQLAIDHGLAVEDVSPSSPAAKANIKKFDILLDAGDKPLATVEDLVKSVEAAKGKQIIITLKRDGQSKKVEAVAEQRTKAEAALDFARRKIQTERPEFAAEIKQLEEAIEKLKGKAGKEGFGMWFAKPAIVSPRVDVRFKEETTKTLKGDFPKDLSVQINKQGSEPTKIHVKRGDQEWEVTEDKLGDLPEEVRTHVQKMLGHMKGPAGIANMDRMIRVNPQGKVEGELRIGPMPPMPPKPAAAPVPPAPPAKPAIANRNITARVERNNDATDDKLDAIIKKLDKLEKEIDELRVKK